MRLSIETEMLEYKKSTGELKEACISIASILNKHGVGTLYFGVKKDGTVIGQDVSEGTLRDVSRLVYESIKPQIYPTVNPVEMDGKKLIKVEFNGEERPYSSRGRYYIRVADEDREISPSELKKFFRESAGPEEWEENITDVAIKTYDKTSFNDFKERAVKAQRIPNTKISAVNHIKRLGLCKDELFNEAGNLLFGVNPKLSLKLAVFPTEHKLTFIDQKTESGNIYKLMRKAEHYIMSNIHWRSEIVGNERIETPEIPLEVAREALANSFAHAMYHSDTVHQVCVFPDRVTIYNPGVYASPNLPREYIKRNLPSVIRNRLIANTLYLSKDVESFGSGFKRIDEFCSDAGVKYDFEFLKTGFEIILYRNGDIKSVTNNVTNDVTIALKMLDLNETEKLVRLLITDNPSITREEISGKISKTVRTVQRAINSLREKGYLDRKGNNREGYWIVLK